jgi:hypothetical protein
MTRERKLSLLNFIRQISTHFSVRTSGNSKNLSDYLSEITLNVTQPPIQWALGLFPEVKLTIYLLKVSR